MAGREAEAALIAGARVIGSGDDKVKASASKSLLPLAW
jgi:hypothetical protein